MSISIKQTAAKGSVALGKQRSYSEVVEFFDKNWTSKGTEKSIDRMKKLDALFSHPSKKLRVVLIAGTNGKSLTAHFATKLLRREGLSVGTFFSPHILTYNERFCFDNEIISNKAFTDLANEVINAAEAANITVTTYEYLTQMALNYFVSCKVDVAILEVREGGASDAAAICTPVIAAITRLTGQTDATGKAPESVIEEYLGLTHPGTHIVSADQNKTNLKTISELTKKLGGVWEMPIRKLVALTYPFEQLHGRCASLAERIASIFINKFTPQETLTLSESLLSKQKGQRGRPTLETKRELEVNPKKTIEHFWKEVSNELPGRFQLLDKENPSILLDNADNEDAIDNFLLGVRLLHYQKPLKGLTIIFGCKEDLIDTEAFAKQVRYFLKKTSGQIIICPLSSKSTEHGKSWDVEKVNNALKAIKVKSRATESFKEAFEIAKKLTNDRNGLIAIAGSPSLLNEYWNYKGIKKL